MHINLSYLIDWLTRHGPHNHMYQFVASRCVSSTWSKWWKMVNIDKQEEKNYILMNTWFWFFLVPKSPVTVFFTLISRILVFLRLRRLPWISQVQSTGLHSIIKNTHRAFM